eukprot:UN28617
MNMKIIILIICLLIINTRGIPSNFNPTKGCYQWIPKDDCTQSESKYQGGVDPCLYIMNSAVGVDLSSSVTITSPYGQPVSLNHLGSADLIYEVGDLITIEISLSEDFSRDRFMAITNHVFAGGNSNCDASGFDHISSDDTLTTSFELTATDAST